MNADRSPSTAGAPPVGGADDNGEVRVAPREKAVTIGAVVKTLAKEFKDVSISKIRYLEDQKLLTPRRTPGGYRVYTPSDVARLRTILRLQRDEFMPLRVIRQELSAGRTDAEAPPTGRSMQRTSRRSSLTSKAAKTIYASADVLADTGADPALVKELMDYGLVTGQQRAGATYYDENEREIIRAAVELARYGVLGRNLRLLKTSADRESALLEQIFAPALRSRSAERRKEAIESLENLTGVTTHMKYLLLVRDLRKLIGE